MERAKYLVGGKTYFENAPELQDALARVYDTLDRPKCLCKGDGVVMCVAKYEDYVLRRMPETGANHHPACQSYELPAAESGLGQVLGEAIIDRGTDSVELRLDFPLTRRAGHGGFPSGEPQPKAEVSMGRKTLSLRGVLHFLWERAGFNRWYPRMEGKRSYRVVRKYLLDVVRTAEAKGTNLSNRLFIPESFSAEKVQEIADRRNEALGILHSPGEDVHFKMMIVVGELKAIRESIFGHDLILKHLPDCPLGLDKKGAGRLSRAFQQEFHAWEKGAVKLVAACVIFAKRERTYQVDRASVMMVTDDWIPIDHEVDADLVKKMIREQRAFLKPLRYEAKTISAFPNFKLIDVGDDSLALDIVRTDMDDKDRAVKEKAIGMRTPPGWVWRTNESATPPSLPPTKPIASRKANTASHSERETPANA